MTALVTAGGAGNYSVADVQAGTGQDRFAGWALFVAYRDNAQPIRRLNVYDGLGTVDSAAHLLDDDRALPHARHGHR